MRVFGLPTTKQEAIADPRAEKIRECAATRISPQRTRELLREFDRESARF